MGKWVIGSLSGGAAVSGLILGLYGAKDKIPPPLFSFALIFLIVCLVILFLILIISVIRFIVEWNRSFQFGEKWHCQYNQKAKHIELHGNVDLSSSSFSKLRGIVIQNGATFWLTPQPINHHMLLKDRYALSFVKDNISISLEEPVNIQVDVWLKNLRKKTYTACLLVTPVGG